MFDDMLALMLELLSFLRLIVLVAELLRSRLALLLTVVAETLKASTFGGIGVSFLQEIKIEIKNITRIGK